MKKIYKTSFKYSIKKKEKNNLQNQCYDFSEVSNVTLFNSKYLLVNNYLELC